MPEVTAGLRERLEAAVGQLRETGAVYAIEDAEIRRIAAALLPVVEAHTAEETALRGAAPAESQSAAALERITVESVQQLVETRTQLAEVEADRARLAAEVADRDQRIAEARRLLAEAERQVAQVEANAAHNAAVFHDVSTDRDRLAAEAKRFDKQWDRLAGDRDRLASQVVSLQDELFRAQSALQSHGAGLVEAEAELGTTSRARDSWYRKAQELRQRAEDAEADRDRLRTALSRALDLLGREQHAESSYTAQGIAVLREAHDGTGEAS